MLLEFKEHFHTAKANDTFMISEVKEIQGFWNQEYTC